MPNWVYNGVVITGNSKDIALVKEQLARPSKQQHIDYKSNQIVETINDSVFQFWNIIAPTNLDTYHDKPDVKQDLTSGDHWYNWNLRNWGVKWDASDVYFAEESETPESLCYTFSTPWGVPTDALLELSRQYPDITIENEWEEEQGYGGTLVFQNGTEEETEAYDSKCRQCNELDTMEYCEPCDANICSNCKYAEFAPEVMCETHKEKEKVNG